MVNNDTTKTLNDGANAKIRDPANAKKNASIIIRFSPHFSSRTPEGIDITPYAIKNANGSMPAIVSDRE